MGLDAIVFFEHLLPYVTHTETALGLIDGLLLAFLKIGTLKVFDVVNGANKVGNVALLFENGQGVGAEAVLGVVDVVVVCGVLKKADKFSNSLLDKVIDALLAGSRGDRTGLEGCEAMEALVVFVEGKDARVVAEFGKGLGEF